MKRRDLAIVDVTIGDLADKEELARQLLERMREFVNADTEPVD